MIGPDETQDPWVEEEGPAPAKVGDVVEELATARGWDRRLHNARIHHLWSEIAGDRLARHTEPLRLHGGVLVVWAASSAWAAQIPYLANEIIARANAVLGEGQVVRVTVTTGGAPRRGTRTPGFT